MANPFRASNEEAHKAYEHSLEKKYGKSAKSNAVKKAKEGKSRHFGSASDFLKYASKP
jgi:hypothetical protein